MLKLTDGMSFFTNKHILAIYLQQVQISGEIFKTYPIYFSCHWEKESQIV